MRLHQRSKQHQHPHASINKNDPGISRTRLHDRRVGEWVYNSSELVIPSCTEKYHCFLAKNRIALCLTHICVRLYTRPYSSTVHRWKHTKELQRCANLAAAAGRYCVLRAMFVQSDICRRRFNVATYRPVSVTKIYRKKEGRDNVFTRLHRAACRPRASAVHTVPTIQRSWSSAAAIIQPGIHPSVDI